MLATWRLNEASLTLVFSRLFDHATSFHIRHVYPGLGWDYRGSISQGGGTTFLALAVQERLTLFATHVLDTEPLLIKTRPGPSLLLYALRSSFRAGSGPRDRSVHWYRGHDNPDPDMVHQLLKRGANPDEYFHSIDQEVTVWAVFLDRMWTMSKSRKPSQSLSEEYYKVSTLLIQHGASPYLLLKGISIINKAMTPSDILRSAFPTRDLTQLETLLKRNRSHFIWHKLSKKKVVFLNFDEIVPVVPSD